jgi:hypothetical protein
VIPCGDDVRHLEATFDVVALEAPDNDRWVEDKSKVVLLPPALDKTATTAQPIAGLPEDFFLTVFNPYHPRKGFEDLRTCAPHSRLPIVWCRSSATRVLTTPSQLENVIVLENVSQANLRYLYEHCRAYVEFGRNIGFGWSLADALQYGAPVLSRWRGVLSIPGLDVRGVYSFTELDELTNLLGRAHYERVSRDTSELSPVRFLERFERVVMRDDTQRSAGRVGD